MPLAVSELFRRQPLFWIRTGAVVLIASLCLAALVEQAEAVEPVRPYIIILLHLLYTGVFLKNLGSFPASPKSWPWLLAAQIALSILFNTNLSVVTAATIPLVAPPTLRARWMAAEVAVVCLKLILGNVWSAYSNWDKLPPGVTPGAVALVIFSGVLEMAAWHGFAYLASWLIVQMDADRRTLLRLNGELRGARILLEESSRLAERLRIARELHDAMGHHLTSMSLQLEVAEHSPDSELREHLRQTRFINKLLLADVRSAVSEWRAERSGALPEALRTLGDTMPGVTVKVSAPSDLPVIAPGLGQALFRCAQEGLTNAVKHGGAQTVRLDLEAAPERLTLLISDDGRGADEPVAGNGLAGIRDRMEEYGGEVRWESEVGKGFRLILEVPLVEEGEA